jgi:hypothetical protein
MAVKIAGVTQCYEDSGGDDLITGAWLDYPKTGPVGGYAFQVFGWVIGRVAVAPIAEVEFVHEGIVVACCELGISRPDVARLYGSSSQIGFFKAIETAGLAPAFTLEVRVVFQDGRRRAIAQIHGKQLLTSAFTPSNGDQQHSLSFRSSDAFQRMFLIHIPKTAGSSVNAFMENCLGERACASHIEQHLEWAAGTGQDTTFGDKVFLSGHVLLSDVRQKLILRNTLVTTVLRDPIDQIISHIVLLRRLAEDEKEHFHQGDAHWPFWAISTPPEIQHIATCLAEMDLGSPVHLKKWVSDLSDVGLSLLDNCQVRYLNDRAPNDWNYRVTERDLQVAIDNLQIFDLIGRSDRVPSFLTKVAEKMRLERCSASDVNVRENISKTKYGLDPRDPTIREALEPLIQFDQVLYDKVASSEPVAEPANASAAPRTRSAARGAVAAIRAFFAVGRPPSADASAVAVGARAEPVERHERIGDFHRIRAPVYYPGAPGGSPEAEYRKGHWPNEGQDRRMAVVEISGVTQCYEDSDGDDLITGAWLDTPQRGPVDRYALEVKGWVVSKAPVAEVEFVHEGIVVACCGLGISRPDVATLYGSSSQVGFSKAIGTVSLASAFTIEVRVVFQDGRRCAIAEICGTQQLTSVFAPSIQPIIVNSLGRSGSTWLMRMIAEHPDIIVHERFPYETYVCSYWIHFLQLLATPVDTSQVDSSQFWRDPELLPLFPYCFGQYLGRSTLTEEVAVDRWYATDQVEEFARAAQAAVESFYREYASSRKRATPAFFAEKTVQQKGIQAGRYNWTMRQLYPRGREIFLLRDPRDTLASVLAFNAQRGFDDFGRELVETDEQYIDVVRTRTLSFVQTWKSTSHRGTLVRYEDLVRSPTEQIRAMLDALGLDSSANIVEAMVKAGNEITADVNAHRTSSDGPSSVGRWKRDLEPRLQKICDEAFDGLLDELDASSF